MPSSAAASPGLRSLSPIQRRIWASQRLHPETPLANMGDPVRLRGRIDSARLIDAFDAVVRRSEVLRMVVEGDASARILAEPPQVTDVVEVPAAEREAWMERRIAAPIDATTCVYDSVLLRHSDDDWTWWLCIHHVAVDASAASLVLAATAAAYGHEGDPADADLSGVIDPAFFDRVEGVARDEPLRPSSLAEQPAVEPVTVGFPPRPAATLAERHPIAFSPGDRAAIDAALAGPLRSISQDLSLVALAAVGVAGLIHRLDGREQVVVGVPLHHRMRKSERRLLGPLMEFAPLVVEVEPEAPRSEVFAATIRSLVDLLRRPPGGASDAAPGPFDVVVNVIGAGAPSFGDVVAERSWVRSDHDDPAQRLGVQVRTGAPGPDGAAAEWLLDLDPGLAPDDVRPVLAAWLSAEIAAVASDPDRSLTETGLLDDAGRQRLVSLSPVPTAQSLAGPVHEQIVDRLATDPERVVIEHGDISVTAGRLLTESERLAGWLVDQGVSPGDAIGLRMERSAEVLVGILGVLRAGAAFVFLDPADPASRREQMVADADVRLVLSTLPEFDDVKTSKVLPAPDLDAPAYVLFTSGSTGRPKGVPVSHRGLADYLRFAVDAYVDPEAAPPVVALHSRLRFDLTITSLFIGLLTDGMTVVFDGEPLDALPAVAADQRITFLKATPSQLDLFARFAPQRTNVRTLVVGGEAFRRATAERARSVGAPGVQIFNEYGPTEAVVGCMIHEYDPTVDLDVDVPIGRACDGAQLVVLDRVGQLAPPGAWGELFVRRPGQPERYLAAGDSVVTTDARFVTLADVVGLDDVVPGGTVGTWYRTGDRARMLRPGVTVYGGRADDQLTVNGIRLEPGEVEAALVEHPDVVAAIVRPHPDGDGLVAWWQASGRAGAEPTPRVLRDFVADRLPRHAVPAAFVLVDEMPLAASAKIDASKLPRPTADDRAISGAGGGEEPATPIERVVAAAWRRVLGTATAVGVTDDLRATGATSLGLLEVVAIVEDEVGVALPIADAVAARTIRAFAEVVDTAIESGDRARYAADELAEPADPLPLSPSEEALLFEYRSDPSDARYHGGRLFVLDADLDPDVLDAALLDVVAHHPPLHVAYDRDRTRLSPTDALERERLDPCSLAAFERVVEDVRRRPFDLDRGPLVRSVSAPLDDGRTALFIGKHHINGDAGTFDVVWRHLAARLDGQELPDLAVSYAGHLQVQRRRHERREDSGRRFWSDRLREWGEPRPLAMATPPPGASDGYLSVDASVTGEQIRASGSTAFVQGLAAISATLAAFAGDDRADFTAAVSTRDLAAAGEVVGNYLNTVPVSLQVPPHAAWSSLIESAERWTAAALEARTVPFATIVRDARSDGVPEPAGSILFVADRTAPLTLDGASVEQRAVLSGSAVTDLTFFIRERGLDQPVEVALEYRGSYASADVAERLLASFADALSRAVSEPQTGVSVEGLVGAADLDGEPLAAHELVIDRWAAAATTVPDALAVVDAAGNAVTASSLADRAAQIATAIGELFDAQAVDAQAVDVQAVDAQVSDAQVEASSVSARRRVGVSVPRSIDLVAAMLAGQLAGAAVVPIDPTLPAARRLAIVDAAGLDAVVAESPELVPRPSDGAELPAVVLDRWSTPSNPASTTEAFVTPDDDAYVIFTSGSTGVPRGVAVSHRNLAASTAARDQWFERPPQRFLVTSSFGFDSSAVGLWWTLATGGTIVLPDDDQVHDVDALAAIIEAQRVTHVLMVPSLYEALLARAGDRLSGLDTVIVAGEACPAAIAARHHEVLPDVALVNEYGPTEATVWATAHRVRPGDDPVPIGRPIPGMTVRVCGPAGRAVAPGVVGELLVSGPGVTAGYTDDVAATAERFVHIDDRRWYRTGDTVADVDRRLQFVGRVDDQLNVGGVRIEPTEIEDALRAVPGVADAVAVAAGQPRRLVAHVVVDSESWDEASARSSLSQRLPAGAVPSRIAVQERLPRTANGKLDRTAASALPLPVGRGASAEPGVEHGEPLATVVRAWQTVFDRPVSADTDFFDVGGDSLAAVAVVTELGAELGREVPIAAVVNGRTPAGMAELLVAGAAERGASDGSNGGPDGEVAGPLQVVRFAGGADGPDDPLVVMTPAWDDVFGYQVLARAMPDDVPVLAFGLDDPTAVTEVGPFVDMVIERLERDGVSDRPLVVVGWSIGGVAAMELAARVDALGWRVRCVGLVDTFFPGEEEHIWSNRWWKYRSLLTRRAIPEWRREIGKAIGRRLTKLRRRVRALRPAPSAPAPSPSSAVGDVASPTAAPTPTPTPPSAPPSAVPAVRMIGAMPADAFGHEPSPVDAPVVFFAASGTNPKRTHRRWQDVAANLEVIAVQGRHRGFESVMAADRVDRLVEGLAPYLRR